MAEIWLGKFIHVYHISQYLEGLYTLFLVVVWDFWTINSIVNSTRGFTVVVAWKIWKKTSWICNLKVQKPDNPKQQWIVLHWLNIGKPPQQKRCKRNRSMLTCQKFLESTSSPTNQQVAYRWHIKTNAKHPILLAGLYIYLRNPKHLVYLGCPKCICIPRGVPSHHETDACTNGSEDL